MTRYHVEVIDHPDGPMTIRHPLCERCNTVPTYGDNAYCDSCDREMDMDDDRLSPTDEINDQLGYDADVSDSSQYCKHGTFIGSWWGPDYLCHWCEMGEDPPPYVPDYYVTISHPKWLRGTAMELTFKGKDAAYRALNACIHRGIAATMTDCHEKVIDRSSPHQPDDSPDALGACIADILNTSKIHYSRIV